MDIVHSERDKKVYRSDINTEVHSYIHTVGTVMTFGIECKQDVEMKTSKTGI